MKTYMHALTLLLLIATTAMAQRAANRNNGKDGGLPEGQAGPAGDVGGPGPRGFFGPPRNAMFSLIDADSDGVISKIELRKAIVQLKKLDTDKDGTITLAEASVGGGPAGPGGGPMGDPAQFVDSLLKNDKNGDGMLSADEVPENFKPMLEGSDTNRDGMIDRAELTAAVEAASARFRGPGGGGPGGFFGGPGGFRGPAGFGNQPFDPTQMTGQLMQNDRNGDGKLSADEVPPQAMGMLQGADRNNDGAIDAAEMQAIMRRMGDRARGLSAGLGAERGNNRTQGRGDNNRTRQRAQDEN